jgi:hypothetical protein
MPEGTVADISFKLGRLGRLIIEAKYLTPVPKVVLMGSVRTPGAVATDIAAK